MTDPRFERIAARLSAKLGARWIQQGSNSYDNERRVFNGAIDRFPLGIAKCAKVGDVLHVLDAIDGSGVRASVRSGGHNIAGRGVIDGGVVIDLSLMKGIDVDERSRTVTAGAGVLWGEFDRETQRYGLAVTGGTVSSTGIAGLTLGGGVGWLLPSMGLTCDNLVSAEVITTAGSRLMVSSEENRELFWALRGGGHGLGVVTNFSYKLGQVERLVGGAIVYGIDDAATVLRHLSGRLAFLPRSVMVSPALLWRSGDAILELDIGIHGSWNDLRVLGLDSARLPRPKEYNVKELPYCVMQKLLDNPFRRGMCAFWKSAFVASLSPAAIDHMVITIKHAPSRTSLIMIEHYHGAYNDTTLADSAYPHRGQELNVLFVANWEGEDCARLRSSNERWAREAVAALPDKLATTMYVNYAVEEDIRDDPVIRGRIADARRALDPAGIL